MKKILYLATMILMSVQAWAAPVDVSAAQSTAQHFLTTKVLEGKFMDPAVQNVKLGVTMPSTSSSTPTFYIFNSDDAFVIVAGDDRAQEILAYGDGCINDLNSLPSNMRFWLDYYAKQIGFPDLSSSDSCRETPSQCQPYRKH